MMTQCFTPSKTLTFATAYKDANRLKAMFSKIQTGSIEVDLSNVTHCDSAGLALLIEAKRTAMTKGLACQFIAMSPEIKHLAQFCGVEAILEIQE